MAADRFDTLVRLLNRPAAHRRTLFWLALSPLAGLVAVRHADEMEARQRPTRKGRKDKKPKPNEFGCLNVATPCTRAEQCCSGICQGKKDKRRCVAHDERICTVDANMCIEGSEAFCGVTNKNCACVVTTGNAPFCGDHTGFPNVIHCRDCRQDADCQAEFGPGAACAVYSNLCGPLCPETGRACVLPCNDGRRVMGDG